MHLRPRPGLERRQFTAMPASAAAVMAVLAHELRTVLTVAAGRLQLAYRRLERGDADRARLMADLAEANGAIRRLMTIVALLEGNAPADRTEGGSADA